MTTVINGYNQFSLPKIWGAGKHASADGTKWALHAQNLISEYHPRYGGCGGIGYDLVSDMYIGLSSRFTTCGLWEGHTILDFIAENESEIRPDTIRADTQGQSATIFGLACMLGIQLQPLFETMLPEMLRVAVSIGAGPSQALFCFKAAGDVLAKEQALFGVSENWATSFEQAFCSISCQMSI